MPVDSDKTLEGPILSWDRKLALAWLIGQGRIGLHDQHDPESNVCKELAAEFQRIRDEGKAEGRTEAIEECARVAESLEYDYPGLRSTRAEIAVRIRALSESPNRRSWNESTG